MCYANACENIHHPRKLHEKWLNLELERASVHSRRPGNAVRCRRNSVAVKVKLVSSRDGLQRLVKDEVGGRNRQPDIRKTGPAMKLPSRLTPRPINREQDNAWLTSLRWSSSREEKRKHRLMAFSMSFSWASVFGITFLTRGTCHVVVQPCRGGPRTGTVEIRRPTPPTAHCVFCFPYLCFTSRFAVDKRGT